LGMPVLWPVYSSAGALVATLAGIGLTFSPSIER